jgi:O-antigen/teichoic acid export membrane protein
VAEICLLAAYQNATQMTIKQVFVGLGEVRWFNGCNLISQAFYLAALVACAIGHGLTVTTAILALFGSGVLSLAVVIPPLLRRARPSLAAPWAKVRRLFGYSVRAAGTDIVAALSSYIDKLVLVPLLSASQLGFYVVAFSFSRTVLLIQPAIASVILSNMSHRSAEEAKRLHDHAFRFGLLAMGVVVLAIMAVDRRLLAVFYGDEFATAVVVFRILLLEASCTCLASITCQLYLSLNRPGFTSAVQGAAILISIVALPPMVKLAGPEGAAYGLLAASVVRLLAYFAGIPLLLGMRAPRLHLVPDDLTYVVTRLRRRAA